MTKWFEDASSVHMYSHITITQITIKIQTTQQ